MYLYWYWFQSTKTSQSTKPQASVLHSLFYQGHYNNSNLSKNMNAQKKERGKGTSLLEDKHFKQFPNGSDHAVIVCYLGLYEEGEVEHINGPTHPCPEHSPCSLYKRPEVSKHGNFYTDSLCMCFVSGSI